MTQQHPAVVYDIESFPNFFSLTAIDLYSDAMAVFEMSERVNDRDHMMEWLFALSQYGTEMIGFNNLNYDYPVMHHLMMNRHGCTHEDAYWKTEQIIGSADRFGHLIWPNDRLIPQIDLFKIHHFDNKAKSTSLKALQFAMRSESVEDLPVEPGTWLTPAQMDIVLEYNKHDVTETKKFAEKSRNAIEFRRELSRKYNRDFMNHNDTKIGKDYFIMELEKQRPGTCYYRDENNRRKPRQTRRENGIALADVIYPYIRFERPEFNEVLNHLKSQRLTKADVVNSLDFQAVQTKGVFKGLSATLDGFTFDFGTGGIHGSLHNAIVRADEERIVADWDVASFYPNNAIANRVYPEHLGQQFCDIYLDVYNQRKQFPKKSAENAMLKLALNGVFGDSNNIYSPFYDPQYTMTITINGQLLLCVLAEQLMKIPGLHMVQINTDGLTVSLPRSMEGLMEQDCEWWQRFTCLELERADYALMAIRDVNSYLAVTTDGKVKRIGAYAYETANENPATREKPWHKDQSALVSAKAAEAALVYGQDIAEFINNHTDPFDFMLRAKAPRGSQLVSVSEDGTDVPLQATTRYYVAHSGGELVKISPPTGPEGQYKKKPSKAVTEKMYNDWHEQNGNVWNPDIHTGNQSVHTTRRLGINTGWKIAECNRADQFDWSNLNRDFYIEEAKKLVDPLKEWSGE